MSSSIDNIEHDICFIMVWHEEELKNTNIYLYVYSCFFMKGCLAKSSSLSSLCNFPFLMFCSIPVGVNKRINCRGTMNCVEQFLNEIIVATGERPYMEESRHASGLLNGSLWKFHPYRCE